MALLGIIIGQGPIPVFYLLKEQSERKFNIEENLPII